MAFKTTFNNISVISWWSVLLVDETRSTLRKTTDLPQVTDKLDPIMFFRAGFKFTTIVVIGTDCTGSYKSNYHTIMTKMAPIQFFSWKLVTIRNKQTLENVLKKLFLHENIRHFRKIGILLSFWCFPSILTCT